MAAVVGSFAPQAFRVTLVSDTFAKFFKSSRYPPRDQAAEVKAKLIEKSNLL